ncbi:porin [Pedobacter changchengzhani]|uniref:Porin n=1 Tax=Pedobacter changchengzhani TaxID=2529274 RepID=A0A4R5MMJ8_9SPHI|nr:porin [Pedobacter changchengzhani]TDG36746.1 porin [Pedobacter changchengzhani]
MKKLLLSILSFAFLTASAQNNNNAPSSYDVHDIKITGYLQTQFQTAQSPGITSFSGGDFAENSDNRFIIRRGRLKIDRVDKYSSIVFQLDGTQNGVQLVDAFIQLREPKLKSLSLTAGLFNRPFGYNIVYSSGYRDFPERPRVFQTIMPRERDIGVLAGYRPHNQLKFLTLEFAVINGSGLTSKDFDSKKDFIGNIAIKFDSLAHNKFHLNFGGSVYKGTLKNDTKTYYSSTPGGFIENTNDDIKGKFLERNYYGANLQLAYDNTFGATTFKTEYVAGKQPGVASSNSLKGPYASQSFSVQPLTNLYARNFSGYYFWVTQQIFKTKLEALISYDVYDPNTAVKGSDIGKANTFTTAGDVKYSTLGYGLTYQVNDRIKFTVYNENVKNESTLLKEVPNDIRDDVFTARLQYRW